MSTSIARPIAVMLFGPPGAGKSMQANLLAEKFNLFHWDTGRQIEKIINNPERQNDPEIKRERELFNNGKLSTPEWTRKMVIEAVKAIAESGKSIVFSGSPRTLLEAEGLIPLLREHYGAKQVFAFVIIAKPETSIFRNSRRRVCEQGHTLIWSRENDNLTHCPKCGAGLRRRSLDIEETIRVRINDYENRTKPVLEYALAQGIDVAEIDGEPEPAVVHQNILKTLEQKL